MSDKLKALCAEHGITFGPGKFAMHMSLSNAGIRVDVFDITWPNNPCDGKKLNRQVDTPKTKNKGWGKGRVSFYLAEDKTPEFSTVEEFIEHYAKETTKPSEPPAEPRVRVKPKKDPS